MEMSEGAYQEMQGMADEAGDAEVGGPGHLNLYANGPERDLRHIPDAFEGLPEEPNYRILEDDFREIGPLGAVASLYEALARAQANFGVIAKNRTAKITPREGRGQPYTFDFADLEAVLAATRPHLNREGIFLTQFASQVEPGVIVLRTALVKGAGKIQAITRFAYEGDIKAMGGAITYHRRYHLNPMLGVSADADADDGPSANEDSGSSGPRQPPTRHPEAIRQADRHQAPATPPPAPTKAPSARAASDRPPAASTGPVTDEQKASISAEVRRLKWAPEMVTTECRRVTGHTTVGMDEGRAAIFLTHLRNQKATS